MLRLAAVASKLRADENDDGAHGEQHGVGNASLGAMPAEQFGRDGRPGVKTGLLGSGTGIGSWQR